MRHVLFVVLFALPLVGWAQSTALTETEALRLGLSRTDIADLERATIDVAEADALATDLFPNPTLGYTRDRIGGDPESVEETWQITQTFDLSGRRGLRHDAAWRRVDAATAANRGRRAELLAEIRRRFYETLHKQEAVQATETWNRQFARVEGIVERLTRTGEASGYDRRRLARERQAAEARLATEIADLERSRERLAALIGRSGGFGGQIAGVLLPPPPPPIGFSLAQLEQRPDLLALARRAEAADLEGRAAARGWIPEVTLGVGPKRVDDGFTRDSGIEFSVSIPLPLFDRQQAGEKRAAAEALQARAESGLARTRAEGELRGLHRQVERLTAAAADYRNRAVATSAELLRIAEAAYQGGESTLLELLDAYRGALDAEITALDLEWKARDARIEYDLLTGSVFE